MARRVPCVLWIAGTLHPDREAYSRPSLARVSLQFRVLTVRPANSVPDLCGATSLRPALQSRGLRVVTCVFVAGAGRASVLGPGWIEVLQAVIQFRNTLAYAIFPLVDGSTFRRECSAASMSRRWIGCWAPGDGGLVRPGCDVMPPALRRSGVPRDVQSHECAIGRVSGVRFDV